jgi:hypothetical protein
VRLPTQVLSMRDQCRQRVAWQRLRGLCTSAAAATPAVQSRLFCGRDLRAGLDGARADFVLGLAGLHCNKNTIPTDTSALTPGAKRAHRLMPKAVGACSAGPIRARPAAGTR